MVERKVLSALAICSFFLFGASDQSLVSHRLGLISLTPVVFAQDLSKTVLPITELKWIGAGVKTDFGTGFCLDPACRLIGTNYHVAMIGRPRKIKGEKVIQRYLATGPNDDGATLNDRFSTNPMKYNISRDLAIFELRQPLRKYHGIPFSLTDLQIGQQVDIFAFPKESISPFRGLMEFHGSFKGETTDGLLAFDYILSKGKAIRPGASGGLIVDSESHHIVGILNGVARNQERIALAVPIQSLADFVASVQPWIAQTIFPSATRYVSPVLADIHPEFVWPHDDLLQHRPDESPEVKFLQEKAQLLANSIRNFIAVRTFEFGSGGSNEPVSAAEYEVQVIDGFQRFRDPDTDEEFRDMPFPLLNTFIGTGGEWSQLPAMVGTALSLRIHQFADTFINGRKMKVFQYRAEAEDGVPCNFFNIVRDYGFFEHSKIVRVPCYGEVWTDESANIERISEHIELPESEKWKDQGTVVTYGWLRLADKALRLVPLTIATEAEYHKKVYWCRGVFTNYRAFTSESKIVATKTNPQP